MVFSKETPQHNQAQSDFEECVDRGDSSIKQANKSCMPGTFFSFVLTVAERFRSHEFEIRTTADRRTVELRTD
jgi:hypothetical protein